MIDDDDIAKLIEILQDDDEPVYVAFNFLEKLQAKEIDFNSFLSTVEILLQTERISLYEFKWIGSRKTSTRLLVGPHFLTDAYRDSDLNDPNQDPLNYYLSLDSRSDVIIH